MGIIAYCPQGHRVKVKDHLAGRKGICPECGARFRIPVESEAEPVAPSAVGASDGASLAVAPLPVRNAAGPPVARIVSLDADLAASLPRALPLATPGGAGTGG